MFCLSVYYLMIAEKSKQMSSSIKRFWITKFWRLRISDGFYLTQIFRIIILKIKVVLGNLPDDFLKPDSLMGSSPSKQENIDRELAIQIHQQQRSANIQYINQSYAGQLIITIVEVKKCLFVEHELDFFNISVFPGFFCEELWSNSHGSLCPRTDWSHNL